MIIESFELEMHHFYKKPVKFRVDIFYHSDAVMRFRLTGGQKIMELEKRLLQKSNKWKILSANFDFKNGVDDTRNLNAVFRLLDEKIEGKAKHSFRG